MKIELANDPCIVPIDGFGPNPEAQPGYWAKFSATPAAERLDYDTLTTFVDEAYGRVESTPKCSEASVQWRLASLLTDRAGHPTTSDAVAEKDFGDAQRALDKVFEICEGAPLNRLTVRAMQFAIDLPAYRLRRNGEWLTDDELQTAREKRAKLLQGVLKLELDEKRTRMAAQLATRLLLERHPSCKQTFTAGARERAEVGPFEDGTAADFYGWLYHDHDDGALFAEKLPMKAYVDRRAIRLQRSVAPDSQVRRFALGEHAQHMLARYGRKPAAIMVASWLSKEALGARLDGRIRDVLDVLTQRTQSFLVGANSDCCS